MNTLASEIILNQLLALKTQLACFRAHRAQLYAAYGTGDVARAKDAAHGVRRALQDLATTYANLRRHVVGFDAASTGEKLGSFDELALRAQALVEAAQLNELATALGAERPSVSDGEVEVPPRENAMPRPS